MTEKVEKTTCPVELKPLEEWVRDGDPDDPENCRPCLLAPVAQWYDEELREQGRPDLAKKIADVAEVLDVADTEGVLTLCREMDNIKTVVEGPLRERLEEFDCAVEAFDPDAAVT